MLLLIKSNLKMLGRSLAGRNLRLYCNGEKLLRKATLLTAGHYFKRDSI